MWSHPEASLGDADKADATVETGPTAYVVDPHSPWQRGTNATEFHL
jgi:IS30 family transposase